MSVTIYLEGGGNNSKELHARCREGFRKLLERCGFAGKMPTLVACGGRGQAFKNFCTAHNARKGNSIVLMLIDSEDPMSDIERTWQHLASRDPSWIKPATASDDQVLMMTTCMETWIVADRAALRAHYGSNLNENQLPALVDLEGRGRQGIQDALERATSQCSNKYQKGKRSFQVLAALTRATLEQHLPSFVRDMRILEATL